ncbi:hypothetical protein GLV94_01135 [Virgibacillus halodenitrificans]|uniref:Uncharacterized protein n=1 Tax=Virgibacillus halodenitrificans TaxID=1482 RepID=A0AAC9IXN8_VIRHA|nr:hypothetical protein [Virgibacillus halodenitrificans]APC47552.1 hypothetical protein BME96_04930 [Virgibacillus halodenitrificans]MCG1028580.1 hypothetical protein [Virgibacillus halodenitrificans]MYL44238.1 hypothetical protein [Virgibacillus halodenitrificans]CDQ32370.1 hypothetical protein BN993_01784 [Virgibacillus halodenitrificans]
MAEKEETKEEMLIQAIKTQYSILQLLDRTLLDVYQYEKGQKTEEQNSDLINLAYQARSIIAKKPKLKETYRKLEEEYGIQLTNHN